MNLTHFWRWSLALLTLVAMPVTGVAAAGVPAALRLPAVLSDNMILQQDKPAQIWGWAPPGKAVTVQLATQKKTATASGEGRWSVKLDPLKAGGPYELTVVADTALTVKNVLVGEVWLASGQSNMVVTLAESANGAAEIQAAKFPQIRLFKTKFHAPDAPADDLEGKWVECTPQTAGGFSGVAYFFGRELHQNLKVPVGLIQSAHGATPAENWVSLAGLKSEASLKPLVDKHDEMPKDSKGWDPQLPTGLYNGEIAPLTPLALRGFIWYQGETNGGRAAQYRTLFPLLIKDWRKAFGEDLPFYFVQLANHMDAKAEPVDEAWAELREAQTLALTLPQTGMAVAIDVGDAKGIHPKNKQDVGHRLALNALARTYGQKVEYSGPMYQAMKVEGDKIRLTFAHVGKGLDARGGALKRFAIAGEDKKFVWGEAVIDGDTVVVSSAKVAKPVAVRYAWANNPEGCNLYNKDGLPAAPFRTDDFPMITAGQSGYTATGKPWTPPPPIAVDPNAKLTGNTIQVIVGKPVIRTWDHVRATDYV